MAQFVEYPYRWSWRDYHAGPDYTTVYSSQTPWTDGMNYVSTYSPFRVSDVPYLTKTSMSRFALRELVMQTDPVSYRDAGPCIRTGVSVLFYDFPLVCAEYYQHPSLRGGTTADVFPGDEYYGADTEDLMLRWRWLVHMRDGSVVPADDTFRALFLRVYNRRFSLLAGGASVPFYEFQRRGTIEESWEEGSITFFPRTGTTAEQVPAWMLGGAGAIVGVTAMCAPCVIPTEADASTVVTTTGGEWTEITPGNWGYALSVAEDVVDSVIPTDTLANPTWYARILTGAIRGMTVQIASATDGGEGDDSLLLAVSDYELPVGTEILCFQVADGQLANERDQVRFSFSDEGQTRTEYGMRFNMSSNPTAELTAENIVRWGLRVNAPHATITVIPAGEYTPSRFRDLLPAEGE